VASSLPHTEKDSIAALLKDQLEWPHYVAVEDLLLDALMMLAFKCRLQELQLLNMGRNIQVTNSLILYKRKK
jgi:hypothetical protein